MCEFCGHTHCTNPKSCSFVKVEDGHAYYLTPSMGSEDSDVVGTMGRKDIPDERARELGIIN